MSSSLTFSYPAWFILLCLALGAAVALTLYFRNSFIKNPTGSQKRLLQGLAVLRFLSVSLLAFLLLSPFLKTSSTETKKPIILFLQDGSESVAYSLNTQDSAKYIADARSLTERLKENFDLEQYLFSQSIEHSDTIAFKGKATNISDNLGNILNLYSNQNVGAVVLATDGIYNQGANPLYAAGKRFPVYTVAMGDTVAKKDLKLEKVYYNKIVYLGDRFKIETDAVSQNLPATTSIDVFDYTDKKNPKKLATQALNFNSTDQFLHQEYILEAKETGVRHYKIVLQPLQEEFTDVNNTKDIFIDVLDSRQKILLVANSPHPDISALKQAIEQNKNYEVTVKYATDIAGINVEEYNLAILHQLPSMTQPAQKLINELNERSTSILFIIGSQTSVRSLNEVQRAMKILQTNESTNEATAQVNENFSLFTLSEKFRKQLSNFPPVAVPFGRFQTSENSQTLLSQKIGSVNTTFPLVLFDASMGNKTGIIFGEGIWRWRLYNYRQQQNHEVFNELINKSIQYLSVKEDKRPFRVSLPKNIFYENERISFEAELYNESYELVNTPDVSLTITDEEGNEFPFLMNKVGKSYTMETANFPVGVFTYRARVIFNGKELSSSGQFTIIPTQLEAFNTVADHQLLYQLSEQSGGRLFYPDQLAALGDTLLQASNLKPTVYEHFKTQSIIHLKWIFFVLMALISAEWFMRKYNGGY